MNRTPSGPPLQSDGRPSHVPISHVAEVVSPVRAGALPESIQLIEVGPRDGLQLEHKVLTVQQRRELIVRLQAAGLLHIEAASFVSERLVPQMAGAGDLVASLPQIAGTEVTVLILNERGTWRALESGARHLRYVVPATDAFSQRNQAASVADSLEGLTRAAAAAREHGATCTAIIAVAFGCPFEGAVPVSTVTGLAEELFLRGSSEVTLADTVGYAVPSEVENLVGQVADAHPGQVGAHFHDTRNTGIANAVAAIRAGATHLDSSIGGLGGCPFAPGASGNVATEDLVYCLESMGISTGADLPAVIEVARWLGDLLDRPLESALLRAGIPSFRSFHAPTSADAEDVVPGATFDPRMS